MPPLNVQIESSWKHALADEFGKEYFVNLVQRLKEEKRRGKVIYPPGSQLFAAFEHTPVDRVRVVIIGQDPYHGPGQAHGLCFSVKKGTPPPPSLVNIFREIQTDLGLPYPESGDLTPWADQGVLLLNAVLTVENGRPGSHQGWGWEKFTDAVIQYLSRGRKGLVFMLWGGYAKKKGEGIDQTKHLVLTSGHPSPLSANKGFWFGNRHFSKANAWLIQNGNTPVDWRI